MRYRSHSTLAVVVALTTLAGCGDSGRTIRPRLERGPGICSALAPLVPHIIAPQATDPAIDQGLANHYAWLDPDAPTNYKLLVFMPGANGQPAQYQLVQQEAARLGYHVIGLMYQNSGPALAGACAAAADSNACFEDTRLEILDGIHRANSIVSVSVPNSINNRLSKLLAYLDAQFPDEGWSRFLADDGPAWQLVAVSGHSQGGGQAALIAKLHTVARVVVFSSPPDVFVPPGATPWVAAVATPSARYFGLAHDREPLFSAIRSNWDLLGMDDFGAAVVQETSAPPYGFTHMLVTDLLPQSGSYNSAHGSTAVDILTPLDSNGVALLQDAWRYLLGH